MCSRRSGVQVCRGESGLASLAWCLGGEDAGEYPTSGYNKQIFRYPPGISNIHIVSHSKHLNFLSLPRSLVFHFKYHLLFPPWVKASSIANSLNVMPYFCVSDLSLWFINREVSIRMREHSRPGAITWSRVGIIGISSISDEDWVSPNTSWLIILHNTRESQLPIIISEFQIFWSMLNVIEC